MLIHVVHLLVRLKSASATGYDNYQRDETYQRTYHGIIPWNIRLIAVIVNEETGDSLAPAVPQVSKALDSP